MVACHLYNMSTLFVSAKENNSTRYVIKLSWSFFEGCVGNKIIRLTLIGVANVIINMALRDKDKWVSP